MDYEKKYNEALERARANYKADKEMGFLENCDMLELIFPELRESEDEKFRKYILQACKECVEANDKGLELSMSTTKKLLAYLEKQKEQPKEELVYRLNGLMQDYIKEGKDEAEKEHRFKCYQLFWDALEDTSYFEQKEQKQTDLPAGFYYIDLDGNKYYSKEFRYGDMRVKVGEQKPVELSGELSTNDSSNPSGLVARNLTPEQMREETLKPVEWTERHIADVFEKVGLAKMPPMMEVWQQTYPTAFNRVEKVAIDKGLGIVELHYEK